MKFRISESRHINRIANFDLVALMLYVNRNIIEKMKICMSFCKYHPHPMHIFYPLSTRLSTNSNGFQMLAQ